MFATHTKNMGVSLKLLTSRPARTRTLSERSESKGLSDIATKDPSALSLSEQSEPRAPLLHHLAPRLPTRNSVLAG